MTELEKELLRAVEALAMEQKAAHERIQELETLLFSTNQLQQQQLDAQNMQSERLEQLATVDPLTGVKNRRSMDEELNLAAAHAERTGLPYALAMLDIDHFKKINDQYGHDVGDQVLVQTAKRFTQFIRKADAVIRTGGEEFMILLPNTEESQGLLVAQKLCNHIADNTYELSEIEVDITCSFGLSCTQSIARFDETVKAADALLYKAKAAGRNRVVSE